MGNRCERCMTDKLGDGGREKKNVYLCWAPKFREASFDFCFAVGSLMKWPGWKQRKGQHGEQQAAQAH